jgi:hypothetical protein
LFKNIEKKPRKLTLSDTTNKFEKGVVEDPPPNYSSPPIDSNSLYL